MVKLEALQLRQLAARVLRQLDVEDTVQVLGAQELADGTWFVDFEDRSENTRFPAFAVAIEPDWSLEKAERALHLELRDKLWICPLCQRRSTIRRIVDREAFRVQCERCGRFEIDSTLLDELRAGYEDSDATIVEELSCLAELVRVSATPLHLSADNWRALAKESRR
jgi:hypothetical protein